MIEKRKSEILTMIEKRKSNAKKGAINKSSRDFGDLVPASTPQSVIGSGSTEKISQSLPTNPRCEVWPQGCEEEEE